MLLVLVEGIRVPQPGAVTFCWGRGVDELGGGGGVVDGESAGVVGVAAGFGIVVHPHYGHGAAGIGVGLLGRGHPVAGHPLRLDGQIAAVMRALALPGHPPPHGRGVGDVAGGTASPHPHPGPLVAAHTATTTRGSTGACVTEVTEDV